MRSRQPTAAIAALTLALALAAGGCGGGGGGSASKSGTGQKGPAITIGTKNFPEQFILGELYAQALRAKGFQVVLKSNIGASEIVDRALTAGSLDMYPEYTGVMLSELAGKHGRPASAAAAYRSAKAFEETRGFTLLGMTPFSDANALIVTPQYARKHRLKSIGDLGRVHGTLNVAAPPEFGTRFEGIAGLRQLYGLTNLRVKQVKIGEQYSTLDRGAVPVANVFSTDGQLEKNRYTLLSDPRKLFTFQNVAPVIRRDLVRKNPKIASVLDAVSRKLSNQAMRSMNAGVSLRHEQPAAVARRFLRDSGLIGK
jgi:osmoprotectant transport system substrate-binding protein